MRRADERGFALLLVFLLASIVALGLYIELPRVALESQRQKEQLLIDRGEQYKRAIQLFYKKAGRYPAKIEDLESFQNVRFLRHRYIDPMTGKDEWRLIHINNGMLTDSLVNKPKAPGGDQKDASTTAGQYVGVQAGLGENPTGPQTGGISARDRRRPSEGGIPAPGADGQFNQGQPQGPGGPGVPGANLDPNSFNNNGTVPPVQIDPSGNQQPLPYQGGMVPGQVAPQPGTPTAINGQPSFPGQQPLPGQPPFMGQIPGQPGGPPNQNNGGGSYVGTQPYLGSGSPYVGGGSVTGSNPGNPGGVAYPGQTMPGQTYPGQPGPPVNSNTGGVSPYQTQGNAGGGVPYPQPGMTTGGQPSTTASDMINRILTTPRPGGMPQGAIIGGGIAGVASTAEGEGVKVYNDRNKYKEWEFIFDPTKVRPIQNPNAMGAPGATPASQMGTPIQGGAPGAPAAPSSPLGGPGAGGFGSPIVK